MPCLREVLGHGSDAGAEPREGGMDFETVLRLSRGSTACIRMAHKFRAPCKLQNSPTVAPTPLKRRSQPRTPNHGNLGNIQNEASPACASPGTGGGGERFPSAHNRSMRLLRPRHGPDVDNTPGALLCNERLPVAHTNPPFHQQPRQKKNGKKGRRIQDFSGKSHPKKRGGRKWKWRGPIYIYIYNISIYLLLIL